MTDKATTQAHALITTFKDLLDGVVAHKQISNHAKLLTLLRVHTVVTNALGRIGPCAPDRAPELYGSRIDRSENPVAFIRRVYKPWLGNGLTSADIAQLDPKLNLSLRVFVSTKGKPKRFELPSKSEHIDQQIAELGLDAPENEGRRVIGRIFEAHRMRIKKTKRQKRKV